MVLRPVRARRQQQGPAQTASAGGGCTAMDRISASSAARAGQHEAARAIGFVGDQGKGAGHGQQVRHGAARPGFVKAGGMQGGQMTARRPAPDRAGTRWRPMLPPRPPRAVWHRARADRAAGADLGRRAPPAASRATHSASGWAMAASRQCPMPLSLRGRGGGRGAGQTPAAVPVRASCFRREIAVSNGLRAGSPAGGPSAHLGLEIDLAAAWRRGARRRPSAPVSARAAAAIACQGGDADQRALQRHPEPAHEGQSDALAGEGARPGGDGEPVQRGEAQPGSAIAASTMGASASAWPRSMAAKRCASTRIVHRARRPNRRRARYRRRANPSWPAATSGALSENLAGFIEGEPSDCAGKTPSGSP